MEALSKLKAFFKRIFRRKPVVLPVVLLPVCDDPLGPKWWIDPLVFRAACALADHPLQCTEWSHRWKREAEFNRVIAWYSAWLQRRGIEYEVYKGYYKVAFRVRIGADDWCIKRALYGSPITDAEAIVMLPREFVPVSTYVGHGTLIQEWCPPNVEHFQAQRDQIKLLATSLRIGDVQCDNVGWRAGKPVFIDVSKGVWQRGLTH